MAASSPTIQLTFVQVEGGQFTVSLKLDSFRPLVGQVRLNHPDLAAAIEDVTRETIPLSDGETDALAIAARVLLESQLVDDPALEQLAEL